MQSTVKEYKLPANFTPKMQEELFNEIVELYDLVDDVLASVAADDAVSRNEQMDLVKPFITQLTNSTNILTAFYTEVVRNNRPITPGLQDTFETAFGIFFQRTKIFLRA